MNSRFLLVVLFLLIGASFVSAQQLNGASISGDVTLADTGDPIPYFPLEIRRTDIQFYMAVRIVTDANGHYKTPVPPGIPAGTYQITSLDTTSYEPVKIVDIQVADGQQVVQNIVITRRQSDAVIAGNVTFQGAPKENVRIYFKNLPKKIGKVSDGRVIFPDTSMADYVAATDANGDFSVDVVSGFYILYIPKSTEYKEEFFTFTVNPGDTTNLTIELKVNLTISGTVSNFNQFDQVLLLATSVNDFFVSKPAFPDADGKYILEVETGQFLVACTGIKDGYVYALFYDNTTWPDSATILDVSTDISGIDFTFPDDIGITNITVQGKVTDENSGQAIEGANVGFLGVNAGPFRRRGGGGQAMNKMAVTDADGNYSFSTTSYAASVDLLGYASKEGYFAEFYDGQPTPFTATPVTVAAGETKTGIDFSLVPVSSTTYSISGTVLDNEGNPVVNGTVIAYSNSLGRMFANVNPDNGTYSVEGLPGGSSVILQAWGFPDYIPEFYNDKTSFLTADTLVMNGDKTGINFVLEKKDYSGAIGSVGGKVSAQAGTSQSMGKTVASGEYSGATLYMKKTGDSEWYSADFSDVNGSFSLPVESYGEYNIVVTAPGYEYEDVIQVDAQTLNNDLNIVMSPTAVNNNPGDLTVKEYKLYNAYPNPFNPSTTIKVDLAKSGNASLIVYNVLGQVERVLYRGKLKAGSHQFIWDGMNDKGESLSSGLYFYQLRTANVIETKGVVFMK